MLYTFYDPINPKLEGIQIVFSDGKWIYTPFLKVLLKEEIPVFRIQDIELQKVLSFEIPFLNQELREAFFYKIKENVVGFINLCPHLNTPLDWDDDFFFNIEGNIICRIHGAQFSNENGCVLSGPARSSLYKVIVEEIKEKCKLYLVLRGFYKS